MSLGAAESSNGTEELIHHRLWLSYNTTEVGVGFVELPTWDDFTFHSVICGSAFVALVMLSFAMGGCRPIWSAEQVEKLARYWAREFLANRFYLGINAATALLSCVLHVIRIEAGDPYGNIPSIWNTIEFYTCYGLLVETLFVWLYSTSLSSGVTALPFGRLLVGCFVVPSVLMRGMSRMQRSQFSFAYVSSLRIWILWSTYRSSLMVESHHRLGVTMQLMNVAVVVTCFSFAAAMLIMQVETLAGSPWPWYQGSATEGLLAQRWSVGTGSYFVISMVASVGFGDMWPRSVMGQILTVVVAAEGMWLSMRSTLGIVEAATLGLGGGGSYPRRLSNKHVVVAGSASYQVLVDFVQELYHEDHAAECEDLNLVILFHPGMRSTMAAMNRFFRHPQRRHLGQKVWILRGSAVRRRDLDRVAYKDASMAWLLPNLYAADAEREDVENAMRALAMRRHTPYVRIVALTMKVENLPLMLSTGMPRGDVVCADDFKAGLLGKSCQVQGFVSWACILFKNTTVPRSAKAMFDKSKEGPPPWLGDYSLGLANELYEVSLSRAYWGAPFGAIAVDVLSRSDGVAFLIGVVEEATFPGDETVTKLFPGRSTHVGVRDDRHCKGIFIAAQREAIKQHPPSKNFAWTLEGVAPTGSHGGQGGAEAGAPAVEVGLASKEKQGYVREAVDLEEARKATITASMSTAASFKASRSLHTKAGLPIADAEILVGGARGLSHLLHEPDDGLDGDDGDLNGKESEAKDIFSRHVQAQREAERKEAHQKAVEAEISADNRALAAYRRVLTMAEREEEERWQDRQRDPIEQQEDDVLWGGPVPPLPKLPGAPKEPPTALLVRGGHVLVLALEGAERNLAWAAGAGKPVSSVAPAAVRPAGGVGRHMALVQLLRALNSGVPRHKHRPVVVLSQQVPNDWAQATAEGGVYLVLGPPLSGTGLRRCGVQQAHAVVIYQRTAAATDDPSTVDAEAVFACRLVESLVSAAGKDIPVVCDLQLERNAFFIPHIQREYNLLHKAVVVGEHKAKRPEDEETEAQTDRVEDIQLPFYLQSRFINGQLFVSGVTTALVANMMYNPALASVFQELISTGYVVQPVPEEWKGQTYAELFTYFIRRRNLLPVALLRMIDFDKDEEEMEEAEAKAADEEAAAAGVAVPTRRQRWMPDEIRSARYVCTMPPGTMRVVYHDGVMCMMPTAGRASL